MCDFRAITIIELLDHMKTKHTKKVEVNVHRDSDPILTSCDECDYRCNLNIQLRKHKKTKHNKVVKEKEYSCEICEYKSLDLPGIWTHKLTQHNDETSQNKSMGSSPFEATLNLLLDQNAHIME